MQIRHYLSLAVAVILCVSFPLTLLSADWETLEKKFSDPPLESKSRPLWFWNNIPNEEETREIVKRCKESGYAGLAILPAFPQAEMKFMSPEYLEQYRVAADAAKEHGLKLCLYDEYWFPSGSAGGLLREKHPEHLCKRLDMAGLTLEDSGEGSLKIPDGVLMGCVAMNVRTLKRTNITSSAKDGVLRWKKPSDDDDAYKIMAFVCVPDGQRDLVDYLEAESVQAFLELTYAAYQKALSEHFGTTIDSAFYDEPMLYTPGAGRAWTPRFNEYFEKRLGYDPVPLYPAMFFDIGDETASARNALFGFRATLFSESFVKTIVDWLKPYGMPLTGHLDQEEVVNPTGVSGDAIKFFEYQPIPGLDEVFQYGRGSPMYKLISSAALNYDRHLVMTEVYGGIANMPVEILYKEAMDQAVKGVNMFVPHAVWYDSAPGKVVFQPELSYRTEPYASALPEYNRYIGRLHLILQRPGETVADIAVLYPIESLQAEYRFNGPLDAYQGGVPSERGNYMELGEHLFFNLRTDFAFLHPETIQKRCSIQASETGPLLKLENRENPAAFRTLVLPPMKSIGAATLEKVRDFYASGGRVVAVGTLPLQSAEQGKRDRVTLLLKDIFGEEAVNLAEQKVESPVQVEASSEWAGGGFSPESILSDQAGSRWNAADRSGGNQWICITLKDHALISSVVIDEAFDRTTKFRIQAFDTDKADWCDVFSGRNIGRNKECKFSAPTRTNRIRILLEEIKSDSFSLSKVELLDTAGLSVFPIPETKTIVKENARGGKAFYLHVPTASIDLRSLNLKNVLDGEDLRFEKPNDLPKNAPTRSFVYSHRKIENRDVYFFANSTTQDVDAFFEFGKRTGEKSYTWWNPHDGKVYKAVAEGNRYRLTLPAVRSTFLISD